MAKPIKTVFKDAIEKSVSPEGYDCSYVDGDVKDPFSLVLTCRVEGEGGDSKLVDLE